MVLHEQWQAYFLTFELNLAFIAKDDLNIENLEALKQGISNLEKHIENLQKFHVPIIVTLNKFITDTNAELSFIKDFCEKRGCAFALSEVWEKDTAIIFHGTYCCNYYNGIRF